MRAARRACRCVNSSWRRVSSLQPFALAQQFSDAQNRGQRIVQLVRDARQHLPHGRQFLRLN